MSSPQNLDGLKSGAYKGVRKLKISHGLSTFPREILDLYDTLEFLDLSGNPISSVPKDIRRLHKLKIAFFSDCQFETFPEDLSRCRNLEMIAFKGNGMTAIPEHAFPRKLRWLILTNNKIESLPQSIGMCHRLQKCMLAGNRLTTLPDEMAQCKRLGLLRLSSNQLTALPPWLFSLPELSFLSFAGNPCASSSAENPVLADIAWKDLAVNKLLGEGASGIISKGVWRSTDNGLQGANKLVAIKLFKGDVTSDGSPADEMNACITAGQHPNLIDPLGKIQGHPEKRGLVLELIPPDYNNLGLPPTLDSCTRDAFPPGTAFTIQQCKSILLGIASAAAHLHARGITHGDLYAHNILIDDHGHALLGDFGAATIYTKEHEKAELIERLEVLGFGHLVEDLLGLVTRQIDGGNEKEGVVVEGLNELHWKCVNPLVGERPSFEEVYEELGGL